MTVYVYIYMVHASGNQIEKAELVEENEIQDLRESSTIRCVSHTVSAQATRRGA